MLIVGPGLLCKAFVYFWKEVTAKRNLLKNWYASEALSSVQRFQKAKLIVLILVVRALWWHTVDSCSLATVSEWDFCYHSDDV